MATSCTSENPLLMDDISEVSQKLREANLDQPNHELMVGAHILTQPVEKDHEFLKNKEVFKYFVPYVNL